MPKPKTSKRALQMRAYRAQRVTITQNEADMLAALVAHRIADVDARLKAAQPTGLISLELLTASHLTEALIPILAKLKGES